MQDIPKMKIAKLLRAGIKSAKTTHELGKNAETSRSVISVKETYEIRFIFC